MPAEAFIFFVSVISAILIIEGLVYALFTRQIRRMLLHLMTMEDRDIKVVGLSMALAGVVSLFFLSWLNG